MLSLKIQLDSHTEKIEFEIHKKEPLQEPKMVQKHRIFPNQSCN